MRYSPERVSAIEQGAKDIFAVISLFFARKVKFAGLGRAENV